MRILLFLLIFLAAPVLADPTKADLRALVTARDIDGVEAMMEAAYRESLVSHNYDVLRYLNEAFPVTDPKMRDFIAAWRLAKPESPHAMAAQAELLWHAGVLARGGEIARWTYPDAFALQQELNRQARELAWQAYDLAPDMVLASDAVVRIAKVSGGQYYVPDVLAEVMAVTPNHSSLIRGTNALAPNWGGSLETMAEQCALYAGKIPDVSDYTANTCLIDVIFSADIRGWARTWAQNALDNNDNPILEQARITDAMHWRQGSEAANKVLARYLANPDNVDWNAAGIHDQYYRVPHNLPPLAPEFFQRRYDHAIAEIAFDPYNQELLQIVFENVWYEGQPPRRIDESLELEAKRRTLMVAPYNAEAWSRYGSMVKFAFKYKENEYDRYFINAIVYSNHRPYYLSSFGTYKLIDLLQLLYGNQSSEIEIRDLPESVELVDALVCPLVRVSRVMDEVCASSGQGENQCMAHSWPVKHWQQVVALAEAENVCTDERTAPIDDLWYQPQDIDWSTEPRFAGTAAP